MIVFDQKIKFSLNNKGGAFVWFQGCKIWNTLAGQWVIDSQGSKDLLFLEHRFYTFIDAIIAIHNAQIQIDCIKTPYSGGIILEKIT